MPMTCSICRHQQRALIESALLENEPLRNIAKQFSCGYSSIRRHKVDHLPSVLGDAYRAKQRLQDVVDVPQAIQERRSLTWALLDRALEPLTDTGGTFDSVDTVLVARLLRLLQNDDMMIVEVFAKLPDSDAVKRLVIEQWRRVMEEADKNAEHR